LILIAGGFAVIVGISYGQNQVIEERGQDDPLIRVLSVIASFAILFVNTFLVISIRKLANFEKHTTHTEYYAAVASKQSVA